jgi:hypothetical protein
MVAAGLRASTASAFVSMQPPVIGWALKILCLRVRVVEARRPLLAQLCPRVRFAPDHGAGAGAGRAGAGGDHVAPPMAELMEEVSRRFASIKAVLATHLSPGGRRLYAALRHQGKGDFRSLLVALAPCRGVSPQAMGRFTPAELVESLEERAAQVRELAARVVAGLARLAVVLAGLVLAAARNSSRRPVGAAPANGPPPELGPGASARPFSPAAPPRPAAGTAVPVARAAA